MVINQEPDAWDGIDAAEGYEFDTDDGSYSGPEVETLYSLDFDLEPGEIWEVRWKIALSSEPTDNLIALEILDVDGDYITQEFLGTYQGNSMELQLTLPAWVVNGDYNAPAGATASPDVRLQIAGADGGNYWGTVEAVRLRSPLNNGAVYQGSNVGFLDGGSL